MAPPHSDPDRLVPALAASQGSAIVYGRGPSCHLAARQDKQGFNANEAGCTRSTKRRLCRNQTSATNRASPRRGRWRAFSTPNVRGLATTAIKQAAKQVFSTEKQRERTETTERQEFWRFARSSIEHRAKRHTGLLRGLGVFSLLLRVKNLLAVGSAPTTGIDVSRPAGAKTRASRNTPAPRAVLAEAPSNHRVTGVAAEIRRGPR